MTKPDEHGREYDSYVEIASGVYWVGFFDAKAGLHCNPYLVVDGDEAVVIDGGSRPDFPTVMLKIMQTGVRPDQIRALVYQHYDPDLCGSIPNFEDLIGRDDLEILSAPENLMFIRHYAAASRLVSLTRYDLHFEFASGRRLEFYKTPYSHAAGSFVTFDPSSGVLFTSDLFGSYSIEWDLYLKLSSECRDCRDLAECIRDLPDCPVDGILRFHRNIMTSTRALRHALETIAAIPYKIIAPQHGSLMADRETCEHVLHLLSSLEGVGIDGILNATEA
jgi:flavorubredoxin